MGVLQSTQFHSKNMKIDLNKQEVTKILKEKFGEAQFRVFYTESDKIWEERNKKKISELVEPPTKESYVLYFEEEKEESLIPF